MFDRAEPQLNLRWIQLKNKLGLPHLVSIQAFEEVSRFADAELSALVLLGGWRQPALGDKRSTNLSTSMRAW